jgi:hypothetical protein
MKQAPEVIPCTPLQEPTWEEGSILPAKVFGQEGIMFQP